MRSLLLIFSLLIALNSSRAEIACGYTLEWLADTCPYVGIYTCTTVAPVSSEPSRYIHFDVVLNDSLRGTAPHTVSFDYPKPDSEAGATKRSPQKGDKFLVFLRDAGKDDIRWEQIISLTYPAKRGEKYVALEPDFSVLSNGTDIEKAVRRRIAAKLVTPVLWGENPTNSSPVSIPFDTPAFRAIWGGSSCFLIIPDDLLDISKAHQPKSKP